MTKQKKFITCDGNQAAAQVVKTSSAKLFWFRKCNQKVVLPVLFTAHCRQVH